MAFHEHSEGMVARRVSVSAQLRRAIDDSELELHYQPIWSLGDGPEIDGVEALLRWRHPDRGLMRPRSFMNLAEQSSVSDEISTWVLSEVCRHAAGWPLAGLTPRICINVSHPQLLIPGLAERFSAEVSRHGLDPGRFIIELTESAWTVDADETLAAMADLRTAGRRWPLTTSEPATAPCRACVIWPLTSSRSIAGCSPTSPTNAAPPACCGRSSIWPGPARPRSSPRAWRIVSSWPYSPRSASPSPRASCSESRAPHHEMTALLQRRAARRPPGGLASTASLRRPMAVPKQKQSHARTTQRRSQHKITAPDLQRVPAVPQPPASASRLPCLR